MNKAEIVLKKSRILTLLLLVTHLGAIISCLLLYNPAIEILLIVLCIFSFYLLFSRYAWLSNERSIIRLYVADNVWYLENKTGLILTAQLKPNSYITSSFLLLNFALTKGGKISVPIFYDGVEKDDLRRLRVYLLTLYKDI